MMDLERFEEYCVNEEQNTEIQEKKIVWAMILASATGMLPDYSTFVHKLNRPVSRMLSNRIQVWAGMLSMQPKTSS